MGITLITTLSSSYKNTLPLSGDVVSMLSAAKKSDKKEEIAEILQTLRNGDILVMSVHSNPSVFAIGKEAMHWACEALNRTACTANADNKSPHD